MRHKGLLGLLACAALAAAAAVAPAGAEGKKGAADAQLDLARIERLTGAKATLDAKEGVIRVSVPRTDLAVTAGGVRLTPPMGLTSWAAFKSVRKHVMVMGDMVLLEDQVNPVMDVALANGLEVTALHNHFLWESPRVMFMHVGGMGEEAVLAAAVGELFAKIEQTSDGRGDVPMPQIDPAKSTLDPQTIEAILGHSGEFKAGVYKLTVGCETRMHGAAMGSAMGVNTWAAFAGSERHAIVDGDVAMLESELQSVLRALRRTNIQIVAIHNHMTGESPRMIFLHYWGIGTVEDLARGVKAALDSTRHR